MAGDAQEPHQSRCDPAPVIVVRNDGRCIADAERGHSRGEHGGRGKRVTPFLDRRRGGQAPVEVDEDRVRQVLFHVGVIAGPAVQVPAHVGDNHLVVVFGQPRRADDGRPEGGARA